MNRYKISTIKSTIRGLNRVSAGHWSILRCDTMLIDKYLPSYWKVVFPSSSVQNVSRRDDHANGVAFRNASVSSKTSVIDAILYSPVLIYIRAGPCNKRSPRLYPTVRNFFHGSSPKSYWFVIKWTHLSLMEIQALNNLVLYRKLI